MSSWGHWKNAGRGWVAVSCGVFIGVFIWLLVSAGAIYDYQDSVDGVRLPEVDAIVCLAGGRGRISNAGDLWYRYWEQASKGLGLSKSIPILYFSGLGAQSTWKGVRNQLRPGVMPVIDPTHVVLETQSTNTEQNAEWLIQYARERNWSRVLLLTSRYHMKRARLIFERQIEHEVQRRILLRSEDAPPLEKLKLETISVYQEPFEPGEWTLSLQGIRVTVEEYLKWLYYFHFWSPEGKRSAPRTAQGLAN